jgi:hypothetical protein
VLWYRKRDLPKPRETRRFILFPQWFLSVLPGVLAGTFLDEIERIAVDH